MTTTEDDVQVNESAPVDPTSNGITENAEAPAAVKYPTFRELAFAVWKLAYRLAYVEDQFCAGGANEYLEALGLPNLVHVEGSEELQNSYLTAWFNFHHWNALTETGEINAADDAHLRAQLARTLPRHLQRKEPKSRETMNGWLEELGLEQIAEPRHVGAYHVEHAADVTVNSAMITRAFNAMYPEARVSVQYDHRVR